MTTAILPELARDAAESVRRALDQRQAAGLTPRDARDLLFQSLQGRDTFRRIRSGLQEMLSEGTEAGQFREALRSAAASAAAYLSTIPNVRKAAEATIGRAKTGLTELNDLNEAEQEVRAFQEWAERLYAWLDKPASPVDWERLKAGQASIERGEYEKVEDVLARLEAGGDL
jgi:hypothetical protein